MNEYNGIDSLIQKLDVFIHETHHISYKKTLQIIKDMYENGTEYDGFAYIEPEIAFHDISGILSQTLFKTRIIADMPKMTLEEMLRYRPSRNYSLSDLSYKSKHYRNDFIIQKNVKTQCPICGVKDNMAEVRGKYCIDCFCREAWNLRNKARECGFDMTFDDAGEWVRKSHFKRDPILQLTTDAHEQLSRRGQWKEIAKIFEQRHIDIGRWVNSVLDPNDKQKYYKKKTIEEEEF